MGVFPQTAGECQVRTTGGAESVDVTLNPAGWKITAPRELNQVLLDLTAPLEMGDGACASHGTPTLFALGTGHWSKTQET